MSWQYVKYPPYAGEWWGHTKHGTVERVTVTHKPVPLPPGTDTLTLSYSDPYIYQFGSPDVGYTEYVAAHRWTHWQPVTPPLPPADPDPQASGLAPDGPLDPHEFEMSFDVVAGDPDTEVTIPFARTVEHATERVAQEARVKDMLDSINWTVVRPTECDDATSQDKMDRDDASAYDAEMKTRAVEFDQTAITPRDLLEQAGKIAYNLVGESAQKRDREIAALKRFFPVLHVLVKRELDAMREASHLRTG